MTQPRFGPDSAERASGIHRHRESFMPHQGPGVTNTTHQLPVFALPEFTLFKGTLVPFHIFEPRYCAMVERCVTDRRLMVVTGLRPGWEAHPDDATAPTFDVGGLGRVVSDRRFPDGRWNIFVHCIERVRITRHLEPPHAARHPVVDVAVWHDEAERDTAAHLAIAVDRLQTLGRSLVRELGAEGAALGKVLGSTDEPSLLSNRVASLMVREPDQRQVMLEERSALVRCQQLVEVFASELMAVEDPASTGNWMN